MEDIQKSYKTTNISMFNKTIPDDYTYGRRKMSTISYSYSLSGRQLGKNYLAVRKISTAKASKGMKRAYRAFIYALLSAFVFSASSVLAKIESNIKAENVAMFSNMGSLVFNLPIAIYKKQSFNLPAITWFFIIIRGAISGVTSIFIFESFHYLPLGVASVIIYCTPVFVTVLARVFFKEKIGKIDVVTVIFTICGLILISKLPEEILKPNSKFSGQYFIGILIALGALLGNSSLNLITRKLKYVNCSVVIIISSISALIVNIVSVVIFGNFTLPCRKEYLPLSFGIIQFIGMISIVRALQLENSGPIATTRAAGDIIFAFLWQIVYFDDLPDSYNISGVVIVTFAILLAFFKKLDVTFEEK